MSKNMLYHICDDCSNEKYNGYRKFSANSKKTTIVKGIGLVRCIYYEDKHGRDNSILRDLEI